MLLIVLRIVLPIVLLIVLSSTALATVDGSIHGIVRDDLINPINGAAVVVHDAHGHTVRTARTGEDGTFSFDGIPLGDYTVEATSPGHIDAHQHVQLQSSSSEEVELYCVHPDASSTIIEAPEVSRPTRATGSVTMLGRDALKQLPLGEDRPITEVVTTQPGFVLDSFGNVYARGNHANVQYQVDGIPIPDSVGNLFAQALPVRLVESLEILTGGMAAEFGDRLAAVVNLTTRHGGDAPDGQAQIRYGSFQTIEPSLSYSRSFGRLGVFFGGSYLQSQRALDPPSITPILHDDGRSGRGFVRLDWKQSDRDRLELFASYAYNFFQIPIDPTVVPLNPALPDLVRPVDAYGNASPPYVPHNTNATETENEIFATLSWVHSFATRGQLQVAPYYKLSSGVLFADAQDALGPLSDPGSTTSDVNRSAQHGGGVVHYSVRLGNHQIKAGGQIDYLYGVTDYTEYVRAPMGGIAAGQGGTGSDHTGALLSGLYLQDRWDHGRLSLNAGARLDEFHVALATQTNDQIGVSPRLGASFSFLKDLVGHAFAGINWQPPAPLDAGAAARTLGVVPASTAVPYDLKAETDLYGEAGIDGRIAKVLKLGVVGWGRYAWNQLDDVAIGSTNLIANYNFARGRAVGVEGHGDYVFRDWLSAFGNLSWLIAQGQGISSAAFLFTPAELADQSWQTLDHAQTLTANVGATLRHSGASLTGLMAYGSGLRTGPANNESVPGHVRFDATLQYAFDQVPLRPTAALDVVNLFDAQYAYRIANGFVGSSYGAPRSVFLRLAFPLSAGAK